MHQCADAAPNDTPVVLDFVEVLPDCNGHGRRAFGFCPSREFANCSNDRCLIAENCIEEGGGTSDRSIDFAPARTASIGTGLGGHSWACLRTPNGFIQMPRDLPRAVFVEPSIQSGSSRRLTICDTGRDFKICKTRDCESRQRWVTQGLFLRLCPRRQRCTSNRLR